MYLELRFLFCVTGSGRRGWCYTRYLFSLEMSAKHMQFFCISTAVFLSSKLHNHYTKLWTIIFFWDQLLKIILKTGFFIFLEVDIYFNSMMPLFSNLLASLTTHAHVSALSLTHMRQYWHVYTQPPIHDHTHTYKEPLIAKIQKYNKI